MITRLMGMSGQIQKLQIQLLYTPYLLLNTKENINVLSNYY